MAQDLILDNLVKARSLLSEETKWTKHYTARNEMGKRTDPNDNWAASFDIAGALIRSCPKDLPKLYQQSLEFIFENVLRNLNYESVPHFNDYSTTKHGNVLWCLDEAIKLKRLPFALVGGKHD